MRADHVAALNQGINCVHDTSFCTHVDAPQDGIGRIGSGISPKTRPDALFAGSGRCATGAAGFHKPEPDAASPVQPFARRPVPAKGASSGSMSVPVKDAKAVRPLFRLMLAGAPRGAALQRRPAFSSSVLLRKWMRSDRPSPSSVTCERIALLAPALSPVSMASMMVLCSSIDAFIRSA